MSFKQLGLFHRRGGRIPNGIAVATVVMKDGLGLSITVRPDVAQKVGFRSGSRVGVAFGEGVDEGLVALFKSDNGLKLFKASGRGGDTPGWGGRFNLGPTHLPIPLASARLAEEAAYEIKDGSVVFVLPTWAYKAGPTVPLTHFRVVENRAIRNGRDGKQEVAS